MPKCEYGKFYLNLIDLWKTIGLQKWLTNPQPEPGSGPVNRIKMASKPFFDIVQYGGQQFLDLGIRHSRSDARIIQHVKNVAVELGERGMLRAVVKNALAQGRVIV